MAAKRTIIFLIVLAIFFLGEIGATVGTYYALLYDSNANMNRTMKSVSVHILYEFDTIINESKYALARTSAFFRNSLIPYMSKKEYTDIMQFNKSTIGDSIEYYVYTMKLNNTNIWEFQQFCQDQIYPNCSITELTIASAPNLIPIDNQTILNNPDRLYWPIIFMTDGFDRRPDLFNSLIGFDLYSDNNTQKIIDTALNSDREYTSQIAASGIQLGSTYNNLNVIINHLTLIDPVIGSEQDNTQGIASIILNIGRTFNSAFNKVIFSFSFENIDIFVFDTTSENFTNTNMIYNNSNLLYKRNIPAYQHIRTPNDMPQSSHILKYHYTFIDKNWTIYFSFLPKYVQSYTDQTVIIVPVVMAVIFLLLDVIVIILYRIYLMFIIQLQTNNDKNTIAKNMLDYVNHEVRNPLNVIKGLVSYTLDTVEPYLSTKHSIDPELLTTIVSDLFTMNGACDMLEHIVVDILDIRKLESGKLDLDNKNVIIRDFITDIKKTIGQKIHEKQTIKFECDYPAEMHVWLDPYRLKQIMLNFLTNAIKYTDDGKITLQILIDDTKTRFSVIDTGCGIREEHKHKIFKPFNQLSPTGATRYGGIGLGLHLCNMLGQRMGGTVGFISKYRTGSVFWIEFDNDLIKVSEQKKDSESDSESDLGSGQASSAV